MDGQKMAPQGRLGDMIAEGIAVEWLKQGCYERALLSFCFLWT